MRPYDTISVYTMINENFKGGVNNVMLRNKDPVDSRYHQRCVDNTHDADGDTLRNKDPVDSRYHQQCVDNTHAMGTRASVNNKPIREGAVRMFVQSGS